MSESKYTLKTSVGDFTGAELRNSVTGEPQTYLYSQIPYAESFSGENRWEKPVQLPSDHDYTGDYLSFGFQAPQPKIDNKELEYISPDVPSSEDINYVNIWVPSGTPPPGGYPVFIYIHGGWLQYGDPNKFENPRELHGSHGLMKYIIVNPGYRLNVLGFFASTELQKLNPGNTNLGFWDQRAAIEWVYQNITYFGGNPEKITVGGLSAGSYSTFFQLAYELYNPKVSQIIKQVVHFSNALLVQPKAIKEVDEQYEELLTLLDIPLSLTPEEKLSHLRNVSADKLMEVLPTMKQHTFRAVSDNIFIANTLLLDLKSGKFSKLLLQKKNFNIVIGEVANEPYLYSVLDTPTSQEELIVQLENYYPTAAVKEMIKLYPTVPNSLPEVEYHEQLRQLFGTIVADGQVYASSRGYVKNLVNNGFPKERIFRYKVSYRPKYLDQLLDPYHGVIHGMDQKVWFLGIGATEEEKRLIETFIFPFNEILGFADPKKINWGTLTEKQYRSISPTGETSVIKDDDWQWGTSVAETVITAQLHSS